MAKNSPWRVAKEYLIITLGIFLYVLGWVLFLVPNNLIGGGVTGIASIVQYATGGLIKIGWTYFVINAGLLTAASTPAWAKGTAYSWLLRSTVSRRPKRELAYSVLATWLTPPPISAVASSPA